MEKPENSVEGLDRGRLTRYTTLYNAICTIFRALSDAPISVAIRRDLGPLRAEVPSK